MTATKDDFYHVGLTDDEVRKSRTEHGVNLLTPPKRPSLWKLYLEKFEDPVVRVLLVAAFFSLIISPRRFHRLDSFLPSPRVPARSGS